ncbi:MAG: hypothetical protein LBG69_05220 [Zoogloeaceae bacterium]|nr:hypothetical protein [Zoogloeaceae bacterium]
MTTKPFFSFLALILAAFGVLTLLTPPTRAAEDFAAANPRAEYQRVRLLDFVPAARMSEGGRAIFEPRPVRFLARIAQLPTPQKADYLKKVMELMGVKAEIQVSQRIALEYGGEKALAAYVEDRVAARIKRELKTGDARVFYAFHVYNNRYGPALVITSFEEGSDS